MLRSEDVHLGALAEGGPVARIVRRTFLGDRVQLHLALDDEATLVAEAHGTMPYTAGDTVCVSFEPQHLLPAREHAACL